jgi:hypothetical protein
MHVVVIADRSNGVLALGAEKNLVGDGPAEGADPATREVGELRKRSRSASRTASTSRNV